VLSKANFFKRFRIHQSKAMQLLTVVGGTGTQGRSVIEAALKDGHSKIRATTRNRDSKNAQELAAKGVEVVEADVNDEVSLVKAFEVRQTPDQLKRSVLTMSTTRGQRISTL
jgi:NAD(P)-dependent dehydrogenase (short-subunit alcohol dehydrogenase family)